MHNRNFQEKEEKFIDIDITNFCYKENENDNNIKIPYQQIEVHNGK